MLGILRLGHRTGRDDRITTHVALTARSLGADKFILSGNETGPLETVRDVTERWGGDFKAEKTDSWKSVIKKWKEKKAKIVHLTMYGLPISDKIQEIKESNKDLLIVVGAEKVPAEIYELADVNLAVGNQPHSEVAATGIFLDRYYNNRSLQRDFEDSIIKVVPQEQGKKVIDKHDNRE